MSTKEMARPAPGAGKPQSADETAPKITYGRNGVPVAPGKTRGAGFRSYEIFQRERTGETTALIKPMQLISSDFVRDPYPALTILRENYPCYRNWLDNSFWITRYNDVTSLFTDDANYETRPKRWFYQMEEYGRDLREELPVLTAWAKGIDDNAAAVAETVLADFSGKGHGNLAIEFAGRYPLELLGRVLDLPKDDVPLFAQRYWRMQRGCNWEPRTEQDGREAIAELTEYFRPLLAERRANPGEDLISAIAMLEPDGGSATAEDLVVTLLEADHETLHGGLANTLYLLLTHPDQLDLVRDDRRMVKFAYLEALRHSTPTVITRRFALDEVERFGRLIPEGGVMILAAAAANRDPRQYADPEKFIVGRKDLCQREPRGQYRADGLPAAIVFGMGKPSRHPAVPEDRPRSLYAITRDTASTAINVLLDTLPNLRLKPGATPELRSLAMWEMRTCWDLPVEFDAG
jgi:pulcherriminic acid synthase